MDLSFLNSNPNFQTTLTLLLQSIKQSDNHPIFNPVFHPNKTLLNHRISLNHNNISLDLNQILICERQISLPHHRIFQISSRTLPLRTLLCRTLTRRTSFNRTFRLRTFFNRTLLHRTLLHRTLLSRSLGTKILVCKELQVLSKTLCRLRISVFLNSNPKCQHL
jgi:hypothetical protein